jgi:RNA polymerase sigma-70 factor (ECF subfamily)
LEIANQLLKEHFEGEIEKLRSMIRGYLGKRCQDAEVAESLTQETLYQACRSLPQFRGDCPLSAWVQKIAANLWKKHLERDPYQTGKVISHDFTQPQEDSSAQGQQKPSVQGPENQVLSALLVQQFLQEMSHCCSPEESYVISTHWQGDSFEEIADDLEEKAVTIRSQYFRGHGKLFAHLVQNAPELLGGKERIEEAFQTAVRANEITAREAVAWKSPTGKADDFRSACRKMAKYLRNIMLIWLLWAVLFHRF